MGTSRDTAYALLVLSYSMRRGVVPTSRDPMVTHTGLVIAWRKRAATARRELLSAGLPDKTRRPRDHDNCAREGWEQRYCRSVGRPLRRPRQQWEQTRPRPTRRLHP